MSRSLGTLTLDLIARTGGFESGMDRARRTADRQSREIEREMKARAESIDRAWKSIGAGIAGVFGGIQINDAIRQFVDLAEQIQSSAAVANVSAQQIQVWSAATHGLGIEQEKLADIFKDLDDKVGDFTANGAGPVKDFMEKWGEAAGITADQLRTLAGPDVLQLVMRTMEEAGASTSEVTFMLEALASDASHLTPILKDNAQGLKEAGERAHELGLILSDETLAGLIEVREGAVDLQDGFSGWAREMGGNLVPGLVELKRNLDAVWTTLESVGVVVEGIVNVTFKALASAAITVSKSFEYAGNAIGGTLAALRLAAEGEFSQALGVLKDMDSQLAAIDMSMSAGVARVWTGTTTIAPLEQPQRTEGKPQGSGTPTVPTSRPKAKSSKAEGDPLTDAAKAYAQALDALNKMQLQAEISGLNLNNAQTALLQVMTSPEWATMPEVWRESIAIQGEYAINAEIAAAEQAKLNALIAATPTAQLERQRETMIFLAEAFQAGRISAEQYQEAAMTALGTASAHTEKAADDLMTLEKFGEQAAQNLEGHFANLFTNFDQGVKGMVLSFARGLQNMAAEWAAKSLMKTITSAFGGSFPGFADGGAFGPSGQITAFANGGVVDSPKFFAFANGGSFNTGVMGEAGPEAIMPLKRGADGKLGVISQGGAGNVTVTINVQEGSRTEQGSGNGDNAAREFGREIEAAVINVIHKQQRPGGMLYSGNR